MKNDIVRDAINLRHELHQYPELSGEEIQTKRLLMQFLKEKTKLNIVDRGKWFYAEYIPEENISDSIAFRADFDAIPVLEIGNLPYASKNPGVAHKCGHDGHSAALAAFAMEVDQNREKYQKRIYFIFQYGEETGIGGAPCAELITEKEIKEVYAIHNFPGYPLGAFVLREGTINCASKGMELIFTGRPAHASQPEKGKNPAGTISRLVLELENIANPKKYTGLILATVVQIDVGERAFGVAAHKGRLLLTIRGQHEDEMLRMQKEIEETASRLASQEGLEAEFRFCDEFPETYNHKENIGKLKKIAEENGWPVVMLEAPIRSSEDFGYYLKKAPGALLWLGAGEERPPIHSQEFDYNDELIWRSVEIFQKICGQ
ncbi:MAG: amidohydrolase [Ruminococcus sp.]|nr:amidohydrolase [Ruminococcus sp.]